MAVAGAKNSLRVLSGSPGADVDRRLRMAMPERARSDLMDVTAEKVAQADVFGSTRS